MNDFTSPILRGFQIKAYLEDNSLDSISTKRTSGNGTGDPDSGGDTGEDQDPPYYPSDPADPGMPGGEPESPTDLPEDPPPAPKPGDKDGDGIPDDQDPRPDVEDKLQVSIQPKPTKNCIEDVTTNITGVAEGPHAITKIALVINGTEIEAMAPDAGIKEVAFSFEVNLENYPDGFFAEVKAFDDYGVIATDRHTFNVEVCDIKPPQVRNCLLFDSLHLEYFEDAQKEMVSFDIPSNWLPYAITSKNGSEITVGWGEGNSICLWFSGGTNDSGFAFMPSSIGINYLDENNIAKTTWASSIIAASAGAKNTSKILGDPAAKTYPWVDAINVRGDYSAAPTAGKLNDYVNIGFGTTWNSKQCPLNKLILKPSENIKPVPDPTKPTITPYDPENSPERDCLDIDSAIIQFYNLDDKELDTLIVPKSKFNQAIQAQSSIVIKVGWSEYFKGLSVRIDSGTGLANFPITAVGIMVKDYYGDTVSAWCDEIKYRDMETSKNLDQVMGGAKNSMTWISEVNSGNFTNAPSIGGIGYYAVFGFDDQIENGQCALPSTANSDTSNQLDPNNPPDRPYVYMRPMWNPETCEGDLLLIEGYAVDQYGLQSIDFVTQSLLKLQVDPHDVADLAGVKRYDFSFFADTSFMNPGEKLGVTIQATNIHGRQSPTSVTYDWRPVASTVVKDCSPPPPPSPQITFNTIGAVCSDKVFNVSGYVSISGGTIGRIDVTDQNGVNKYFHNGMGESAANWNFDVPMGTYPEGTQMTFTCTASTAGANAKGGTTSVSKTVSIIYCDPNAPDPVTVQDPAITLYLYDDGTQDDDRIIVYLNGQYKLGPISLKTGTAGDYLNLDLSPGINEIMFEGIRDGGGGCTAAIKLFKRDRTTNPVYPRSNLFDAHMTGTVTNYMFDSPTPKKTWYISV